MMPTGSAATLVTPTVAAAAATPTVAAAATPTVVVTAAAAAAVPTMRVKRKATVPSSTVSTEEKLKRIRQGRSVLARWLQDGASQPDGGMLLLPTASGEEVDRVLALQTQLICQIKAEREAQKPPGPGAKGDTSTPRPAALLGTNADGHASSALRTGSQAPPAATAQDGDLDRYCGLVVGDVVKLQDLELSSYRAFNGKRAVIQRIAQMNKRAVFYVEVDGEGAAVARANLGLKAKPPPGRMSPTWLPCFSNQVNYVGASGLASTVDGHAPTQDATRMELPGAGADLDTSRRLGGEKAPGQFDMLQVLKTDHSGPQLARNAFDVAFLHLAQIVKGHSKCNNWNIFPKDRMDKIRLFMIGDTPHLQEDKDKAYVRMRLKEFTCTREEGRIVLRNQDGKELLDETEVFDALYGVFVGILQTDRSMSLKPAKILKEAKKTYHNITEAVVNTFTHACLFLCIHHGGFPPGTALPAGWRDMWQKRKAKDTKFEQHEIVGWLLKYGLGI